MVSPGTLPSTAADDLRRIAGLIERDRRLLSERYWQRRDGQRPDEAGSGAELVLVERGRSTSGWGRCRAAAEAGPPARSSPASPRRRARAGCTGRAAPDRAAGSPGFSSGCGHGPPAPSPWWCRAACRSALGHLRMVAQQPGDRVRAVLPLAERRVARLPALERLDVAGDRLGDLQAVFRVGLALADLVARQHARADRVEAAHARGHLAVGDPSDLERMQPAERRRSARRSGSCSPRATRPWPSASEGDPSGTPGGGHSLTWNMNPGR